MSKNYKLTLTPNELDWLKRHLKLLVDINSMEAHENPEVESILRNLNE